MCDGPHHRSRNRHWQTGPTLATILLLARDPRVRARLHGALSHGHRLLDLTDWSEAPARLRRHPAQLIVFTPPTFATDPAPLLAWLRRQHPDVGLLLHAAHDQAGREAWQMGRLGVDELVVEAVEHGRMELRRAVRRALARALGRSVGLAVRGRVHPLLERSVVRAVAGTAVGVTPTDLAAPEGLDVASLRRRLHALGLPPVGRILRWGVLFGAAAALDRDEETVETIAFELGYSTGAALSRALRREIGDPPSILRERGALRCAIESFVGPPPSWHASSLR